MAATMNVVGPRRSFLVPEVGAETLVDKPWGGPRLGPLRGGPDFAGRTIGESWEFSTLPHKESRVGGSPLGEVVGGPLPWLAKLLETTAALSLQVHPRDAPDRPGKEEAWVVLEADPGAFVWAGIRADVSRETFEAHVRAASSDPAQGEVLMNDMNRIPVAAGTCILVPAGTTHALGPGVLLAEIQQPTDCTYRFHDFGRPRPLQVDEALAAYVPGSQPRMWTPTSEGPPELEGEHVRLDMVRAGQFVNRRVPREPVLIVPVQGTVTTTDADGVSANLGPGELRLWVGRGTVNTGADGLAVLGTVR